MYGLSSYTRMNNVSCGGMSYTDDIRRKFTTKYKLVQKLLDSARILFRNTERYSHVAGTSASKSSCSGFMSHLMMSVNQSLRPFRDDVSHMGPELFPCQAPSQMLLQFDAI